MNFRGNRRRRSGVALEITPLVDVVFLLLIFFLLTATYVKNPNLDINLPKASLKQANSQKTDLAVAVNEKGELRFNGEDVSLEKLEGVLRAEYAQDSESIVVIQADKSSRHGRVVEVMDLAKRIGFAKLAIATQAAVGNTR